MPGPALAPMNKMPDRAIVVVVLSLATLIACLMLLLSGTV